MTDNDKCCKCNKHFEDINNFILKCSHSFCAECLCEYIEKFTSSVILCPLEGCSRSIADSTIRKCLSNDQVVVYHKYCYPPDVVKCLIKNCPYVMISKEKKGFFQCPICEQPNCISCNKLHPAIEDCRLLHKREEYELKASRILLEKNRLQLINLTKERSIWSNTEKSMCEVCLTFLLPREGIQVSSCFHIFCKNCLQNRVQDVSSIYELTCMSCEKALVYRECIELMGEHKVEELNIQSMKYRFYKCKNDCVYRWDLVNFKGFLNCPLCKRINCVSCEAIHEDKTCKEYRKLLEYQKRQIDLKNFQRMNPIKCYYCEKPHVKGDKCGAIQCDHCLKRICAYYGNKLGPQGCKCTKSKPCHQECKFGCIPDGESVEEKAILKFFNEN